MAHDMDRYFDGLKKSPIIIHVNIYGQKIYAIFETNRLKDNLVWKWHIILLCQMQDRY